MNQGSVTAKHKQDKQTTPPERVQASCFITRLKRRLHLVLLRYYTDCPTLARVIICFIMSRQDQPPLLGAAGFCRAGNDRGLNGIIVSLPRDDPR